MTLSKEILRRASSVAREQRFVELGRVVRVTGLVVEAHLAGVRIGGMVEIAREGGTSIVAEVVGFRADVVLLMPVADLRGVRPGAVVRPREPTSALPVSEALIGRAVDPFGHPIDGGPALASEQRWPLVPTAPEVAQRSRITQRFDTGIRIIDALLPSGRGQRVGIFAGAGVGKTILIRQIATHARADLTVLGLIGERGSEVRDLLEGRLGSRSVVVAATSDRSPMERVRGARAATAVAEFFRDRGANVLLILDSLTRYAMALREVGLAVGEPPTTKGYPPSVFAELPRLLERVSATPHGGSITAFYTVLVEGDDLADPIADSARSLLDGHIVLSRELAARGHFPAIDVLASASRVARSVAPEAEELRSRARAALAAKREVDELRSLGAYVPGASPAQDEAALIGARLHELARQGDEAASYEDSLRAIAASLSTKGGKR